VRHPLGEHSWVDLTEGFVRDAGQHFDHLLATTGWAQTEVLRYDRYFAERRLSCGLRPDATAMLRQIGLHLEAAHRVRFEGVSAILYRDGTDFQGLHSDREMRWLDETVIAIVVLGQRRPFVLRPRGTRADAVDRVPAGQGQDDLVLTPGEGDLLVMGGAAQREWLHGVPAAPTDRPRISLTWRWTSRRGRPDTNPTYYDGQHFSDGPSMPGRRTRSP
ncbi:MAG TPA: alpha-ketoglutarate-dependent dioxygenase AlkB, partial [Microthrixaceae bacterium]|nr:alpha-ketoglutarate-dependent dioxygenase AlkB [Microthrixaceae bacterium]